MVQGCIHPHGEDRAMSNQDSRLFMLIPGRWIAVVTPGTVCVTLGCCPICQIYTVSRLGPAIILSFIVWLTVYYAQHTFLNFYFREKSQLSYSFLFIVQVWQRWTFLGFIFQFQLISHDRIRPLPFSSATKSGPGGRQRQSSHLWHVLSQ